MSYAEADEGAAMSEQLIAKAATSIKATRDSVWEALVTPAAIKQYMFGADVETTWRVGGAIRWKGEFSGKPYEDQGVVLRFEPGHVLQYSHFSPQSEKRGGAEDHHIVTISLAGAGDETEVALTQDGNADQTARKAAEKNWAAMLEGLKRHVERSSPTER
jgi:uncharacterized protein YndB with AHSA1/START domain